MNALENLWQGKINPSSESINNFEYNAMMIDLLLDENNLVSMLNDEQKEAFDKYKKAEYELKEKDNYISFCEGFRLGMELVIDGLKD